MRKRKPRFTLYRLTGDGPHVARKLRIVRAVKAAAYLDRVYGRGHYTILEGKHP